MDERWRKAGAEAEASGKTLGEERLHEGRGDRREESASGESTEQREASASGESTEQREVRANAALAEQREESASGGPQEPDDVSGSAELYELFSELREDRAALERAQERMTEERLDAAVQAGFETGRLRARAARRKRRGLQTLAAALCMLMLLTAFVRISPAFAAIMKEIPGFGAFVELIADDPTLMSALENEYVQPLDLSVSQDGYTFTVNGVLADSQRAVILYTAEGPGLTSQSSLNYRLEADDGGDVGAMILSNHNFRTEKDDEGNRVQDLLDIRMGPERSMPRRIGFSVELGGEWLSVDVPIDHSRFAELEERIVLDRELKLGGQKLTVKEAIVSPLMVSITFEAGPDNDKIITDFIELELVDEKGRTYGTGSGFGRLEEGLTRHFESGYFDKPEKLTLKAEGLRMLDRGLELVIDTEQKELIKRPDDKITIEDIGKSGPYIALKLRLDQSGDPGYTFKSYGLFEHQGQFRDASGRTFRLAERNGTVSSFRSDLREGVYHYLIPDEDYDQPLTFDIYDYPGHVLQEIAVEIK